VLTFNIDPESQKRLDKFFASLGPRLTAETHQTLKTALYQGVQAGIQKYFAGSGSKGGPTASLLTSRSGALANSLLASVETGMDPASPSDNAMSITAQVGSSLAYARIQEYGGVAGRAGPFKKKDGKRPYLPPRPYLEPAMKDMLATLPDQLQQAVTRALKQK
jgi:phage gpG-like protein